MVTVCLSFGPSFSGWIDTAVLMELVPEEMEWTFQSKIWFRHCSKDYSFLDDVFSGFCYQDDV